MIRKTEFSQLGQTLVAIVFLMVLSLGIGITISTRFVKNLKSVTRTDSLSRATAISEAAIERVLQVSYATLQDYINNNSCGSTCYLQITGADGVVATANVTLSYVGNSTDAFNLSLNSNEMSEVNLLTYPSNSKVWVCWNATSAPQPSVYGAYVSKSGATYATSAYAYNSVGSTNTDNGFSTSAANFGYANCFYVTTSNTPQSLRLKAFYNNVSVWILPSANVTLPLQGVLIDSLGTVSGVGKRTRVIKSRPTLPNLFDYVLYSKSAVDPLTK